MQRVSVGGPDYVLSRLEVSGDRMKLYDFVNAAAGPGFLDWAIDWYRTYEEAYGSVLLGGAPSLGAASMVAHAITDRNWHRVGAARRTAELDPTRCPFDLHALIPVPAEILRRGYRGAGEAWLWRHWGVGAPLRQVTLEIVRRPLQGELPEIAAIYRFLSEDWAPAVAIGKIRDVWPGLRFQLACRFPDEPLAAASSIRGRDQANSKLGVDGERHAGWWDVGRGAERRAQPGPPKRLRRQDRRVVGQDSPPAGLGRQPADAQGAARD